MATQMTRPQTTQTAQPTLSTSFDPGIYTARVLAIMFLLTGWGWDNGQFVQPLNTSWGPIADAFHLIPVVVVVPLGLRIIREALVGARSRGAEIGVTVIALITIVGSIVMIVLGATNPDPNSVGVHTAEDWMPGGWLYSPTHRGALSAF